MTEQRHGLLRQLVEIPSASGNEQAISLFCQGFLREAGFQVETVPIGSKKRVRENILASKGTGEKAICFYGHLDTVKAIDKDWDKGKPPLRLTQVGDRYYGLGTSDMKGGVSALLEAVESTDKYVQVLLTVDEEEISEGSWAVVKQRPDFFRDVNLIIAAESSFDLPSYAVTNGRTGRFVYDAIFKGQAEHLMHYELGVDAMKMMYRFGNRFYDLVESGQLFKSPYSKTQIRKSESESIGMSVPGLARLEVEVLQGPEDAPSEILARLQSLTDEGKIKLKPRKTPYLSGYKFDNFPNRKLLGQIIREHTGQELQLVQRSSVGDENVFATLGIPIITWGPSGGNEHRSNEYVEIESLDRIQRMYQEFLENI